MVTTYGPSKGIFFVTTDNIININDCIFQHMKEYLVHNRILILFNKSECKITNI